MRTSLKIDSDLVARMAKAIRRDGYHGKQTSKWIAAVIRRYRTTAAPHFMSVGQGEDIRKMDHRIGVDLNDETIAVIAEIASVVLAQDPLADGIRSQIIRAAIRSAA